MKILLVSDTIQALTTVFHQNWRKNSYKDDIIHALIDPIIQLYDQKHIFVQPYNVDLPIDYNICNINTHIYRINELQ